MKADDLADERNLCNKARMQIDVIEQKENKWDQLGHHINGHHNVKRTPTLNRVS